MDSVCPLLGLVGDPHAAIDGADAAHRCHADDPPSPIDRAVQVQLCLSPRKDRCERYLAFRARNPGVTPGRLGAADGYVSTRLLLAPQPAWRGFAGRARRSRSMLVVGGVAGVAAVGIAGAAVAGSLLGADPADGALTSPSPTVPLTPAPTASPSPILTPTPSPSPTSVPTAAPTLTPAPTPVVTPAPPTPAPQTYTVQPGDTLAIIADRFGTTVAAIQAANGIGDPNTINVGQVLIIP